MAYFDWKAHQIISRRAPQLEWFEDNKGRRVTAHINNGYCVVFKITPESITLNIVTPDDQSYSIQISNLALLRGLLAEEFLQHQLAA